MDGLNIELGCWEGKSTSSLANAIYPDVLICNDTWMGNIDEGNVTGIKHPTVEICEKRDVYSAFLNNMNALTKKNYTVVKCDNIEWLSTLKDPVKFCHIDASHDYFSVKKAIELLKPLVVKNGILCGDDFSTANIGRVDLHGGVERAVRECLPNFSNINNLWYWYNTEQ